MTPFEPLILPNGGIISNRIAKAAMEENLADSAHAPSAGLLKLYATWAEGGAGLILSGNVMIDRRAMTGPGAVVLEDESNLAAFRDWAPIGHAKGAQMWLQLSHPGRQVMKNMGQETWAPSPVALDLGSLSNMFGTPRAMTEQEIHEVIARFVWRFNRRTKPASNSSASSRKSAATCSSSRPIATFPRPTTVPRGRCGHPPCSAKSPTASEPNGARSSMPTSVQSSKLAAAAQSEPLKPSVSR